MSRHMREQVRMGFVAGLASAATWAAVLGCSSSDPSGTSVACDLASGTCLELGETCDSDLQCGSGSCLGGECGSAPDVGGGGSGGLESGGGGTYGFVDDLDPQGGSGGEEESCVDLDVDFSRVTPTVVLLIDQSGSMLQNFENGVNRWQTLRNTLTDPETSLLKKLDTSVRFGMSLYTSDRGFGTDPEAPKECPLLKTVDIALGSFSDMADMLEDNGPAGDTPTAESVAAVTERLAAFTEDGPKSIILATDGDPDTCADPDANNQGASKDLSVAAVTAAYGAGIATHVISVGNQVTAEHLKDLAVAGAGGDEDAEAYTALDTTALVDAFNQIIGSVRTCDFTLQGRVEQDDAARGTVTLDGQALTFGDPNGWEMPDETTVRLLGSACETVQADASGISMRFPCDAIEIILQ